MSDFITKNYIKMCSSISCRSRNKIISFTKKHESFIDKSLMFLERIV